MQKDPSASRGSRKEKLGRVQLGLQSAKRKGRSFAAEGVTFNATEKLSYRTAASVGQEGGEGVPRDVEKRRMRRRLASKSSPYQQERRNSTPHSAQEDGNTRQYSQRKGEEIQERCRTCGGVRRRSERRKQRCLRDPTWSTTRSHTHTQIRR